MTMHSLIIALFISMVLPVAVPLCDPLTQYENDSGQCCKMCGPGTRMDSASSNCQDLLCKPCKDDEYQTGYTTKKICDLHDYCDNNKNKESAGRSKTSKGICRCKTGYHCASDDCITCEPHTICNPGHFIQFRGNYSYDTVCQKCPPDTFSNGTLDKCENCGPGRRAKTQGSPSFDTICEKDTTKQQHVKWIVPPICILVLLIVVGIIIYTSSAKAKVKGCVESCWHGAEAEAKAGQTVDQQHDEQHDELVSEPERGPQQEDTNTQPEENAEDQHDEQLSQPLMISMTENGNMLAQEDGKHAVLSRQESQAQESTISFQE